VALEPPVPVPAYDPFAADAWSLGVLLYAALTGVSLYTGPSDAAFVLLGQGRAAEVLRRHERYGACVSKGAGDLICGLLHPDPRRRLSVGAVLGHPWVLAHTEGGRPRCLLLGESHECL
jgi:calcium-dependent protein kinase